MIIPASVSLLLDRNRNVDRDKSLKRGEGAALPPLITSYEMKRIDLESSNRKEYNILDDLGEAAFVKENEINLHLTTLKEIEDGLSALCSFEDIDSSYFSILNSSFWKRALQYQKGKQLMAQIFRYHQELQNFNLLIPLTILSNPEVIIIICKETEESNFFKEELLSSFIGGRYEEILDLSFSFLKKAILIENSSGALLSWNKDLIPSSLQFVYLSMILSLALLISKDLLHPWQLLFKGLQMKPLLLKLSSFKSFLLLLGILNYYSVTKESSSSSSAEEKCFAALSSAVLLILKGNEDDDDDGDFKIAQSCFNRLKVDFAKKAHDSVFWQKAFFLILASDASSFLLNEAPPPGF